MPILQMFLKWYSRQFRDYPPAIDLKRVLIDAKNRTRGK